MLEKIKTMKRVVTLDSMYAFRARTYRPMQGLEIRHAMKRARTDVCEGVEDFG
jgi:hypothetical protein